MNTINELNQELVAMKEAYERLDAENQLLNSELEKRSIDIDQDRFHHTIRMFFSLSITLNCKTFLFQKKYHQTCSENRSKPYVSRFLLLHLSIDHFVLQVPIHTSSSSAERDAEELRQLRENFATLTAQYAQLDEANRAWQLYHQTQLETFKNKLRDYLPVNENVSFDDIAQQVVDQITTERKDSSERYAELEQGNSDLRSGSL